MGWWKNLLLILTLITENLFPKVVSTLLLETNFHFEYFTKSKNNFTLNGKSM